MTEYTYGGIDDTIPEGEEKDLDLREYMEWTRSTAVFPSTINDPKLPGAMYCGLGLSNEAGEVTGVIKKWFRDGKLEREKLLKELGDVMWYWAALCDITGIDPYEVLEANQQKLQSRKERGVLGGSGDDR